MSKKRTYLDTGVLIAVARGKEDLMEKGLEIFNDPNREFISNPFLKRKVFPKAVHGKHHDKEVKVVSLYG